MRSNFLAVCMLAVAALLLAGCQGRSLTGGSTTAADTSTRSGPPQVAGIALPDGYSLDTGRTIILGEGDRWIGRLSYSINSSANDMFDFVRREMLNYGWSEIAVVRSEISQLTYMSSAGDRVASVLITPSSLYGSKVDMTVSPAAGGASNAVRAPTPSRR